MTINKRDAIIDPTNGHRIDPLTNVDLTEAVANGDNTALARVEVAQLESMLEDEPNNWYLKHSLKSAKKRFTKYFKRDRAAEAK